MDKSKRKTYVAKDIHDLKQLIACGVHATLANQPPITWEQKIEPLEQKERQTESF